MRDDEWTAFCEAYERELYLYAYMLTRNEREAIELVADTFVRAFLAVDRMPNNPKPWLLVICKHQFIDEQRRKKRWYNFLIGLYTQQEMVSESALESYLHTEQSKSVYSALMTLREPYRDVLFLYYYAELSTDKIAKLRNQKPSVIRTQLRRGRQLLRTEWEVES
ncbi:MAG: RNA polymerase sigma factor [Bacilli bacterium]